MNNLSLNQSSEQSELNALAPLRLPGLAQALMENSHDQAEVERLAEELQRVARDVIELLVEKADQLPALETL
jgi:hypothetical protein